MNSMGRLIQRAATVPMDETGRRIPRTYEEMKGHMTALGMLRARETQQAPAPAPTVTIDRSESQEPERWADWY